MMGRSPIQSARRRHTSNPGKEPEGKYQSLEEDPMFLANSEQHQ
jgi:hypothetical protein